MSATRPISSLDDDDPASGFGLRVDVEAECDKVRVCPGGIELDAPSRADGWTFAIVEGPPRRPRTWQ
jgi:hypothetical protein